MNQSILALLLFFSATVSAQVGIGTATPNNSAQLDITASNKGLLVPRMTSVQAADIESPATGLLIFQTDNTPGFYYYNGTEWTLLLSGVLPVAKGGTGSSLLPAGSVLFGNGTSAVSSSENFFWDNLNSRLGILTTSPSATFQIGVETGTAADNLKWGVMNGFNTLQLGYRETGWKLKAGNNSGVMTDLIFATTDGASDVDRLTISQYGVTVATPLISEISTISPKAYFTNLDVNGGKISYNSDNDRVGIFTDIPTSKFQVYGDGPFENPMKYDNAGSTGTLKFGFRGREFRILNNTNSGILTNLSFSYFDGTDDVQSMNLDYNGLVTIANLKAGSTAFPTLDGTSGQVLTTNGSGTATWSNATITEVADEFTADASQTSFTLTQSPSANSKVKMYVNGIRISNTAYSVSDNILTYNAANNGTHSLTSTDRIQFDYFY